MKRSIEQLIMAAVEPGSANGTFTQRVMADIKKQSQTEIFSSAMRTMSVNKKETFMMRLQQLPKLALVAVVAAALLTVTGAAYAISALWPKPSVETSAPAKNQFNRIEISASLKACGDQGEQAAYEIKHGSTLDPAEVEKILQATCERAVIDQWMADTLPKPNLNRIKDGEVREEYMLSSVASKVSAISSTEIALTGDEWNSPKQPLRLAADAHFIVGGEEVEREDIKVGDSVLFIKLEKTQYSVHEKSATETSVEGKPLDTAVTHVVKVDLPFEYYGPSKESQIAKREACLGNPQDSCVKSAMIDLYADSGRQQVDMNSVEHRLIQGVIESNQGGTIKLKTSSGRIFTLQLPKDIITEFNNQRSMHYDNIKVGVGDTLNVRYLEAKGEHTTTLTADHAKSVDVLLDLIQKNDPLKKY